MFAVGAAKESSRKETRPTKEAKDASWIQIGKSFQHDSEEYERNHRDTALIRKKEKKKKKKRSSSTFRLSDRDETRSLKVYRRKKHRRHDRSSSLESRSTTSKQRLLPADPSDSLFKYDFVGDDGNMKYGGIYKEDIPVYYLSYVRSKKRLATTSDNADRRYFSLGARNEETNPRTKRLYLAHCEKRNRRKMDRLQNGSSEKELEFIPLDPVIDDKDENFKTESEILQEEYMKRCQGFNEQLRKNPHDVDLWLEFIAYQDQSIDRVKRTKLENRQVREKELAIIARARASNPGHLGLRIVELNMTSSQNIDVEKALEQFELALVDHPYNLQIWKMYMQQCLKHFSLFSMSNIRVLFAKAITTYRDGIDTINQKDLAGSIQVYREDSVLLTSSDKSINLSRSVLQVFAFIANAEKMSGHMELAVALYQALIEFNLCRPIELRGRDPQVGIEIFGKYWEEGHSRFGESMTDSRNAWENWYHKTIANSSSTEKAGHAAEEIIDRMLRQAYASAGPFGEINKERKLNWKCFNPPDVDQPVLNDGKEITRTESRGEMQNAEEDSDDATLVYSNIHGYRIDMKQTDESSEYQRILKEIKGEIIDKAPQDQKKSKKSKEKKVDERTQYSKVSEHDSFVQWLEAEDGLQQEQWLPIRATGESNLHIIEEHPDRAIFFDEIKPFLFQIDKEVHLDLVFAFLRFMGATFFCYTDFSSPFDEIYPELVQPCFDVCFGPLLQQFCFKNVSPEVEKFPLNSDYLAIADLLDDFELSRKVCIQDSVLLDRSRMEYIRTILYQSLRLLPESISLQCSIIDFESFVAYHYSQDKASSSNGPSYQQARNIAMQLLKSSQASQFDLKLWYSYASLEILHGNYKEGARICEKALALSPQLPDNAQCDTHRLIYVWSRMELWKKADSSTKLGENAIVYILASCCPDFRLQSLSKLMKKFGKSKKDPEAELKKLLSSMQLLSVEKYCRDQLTQLLKEEKAVTMTRRISPYCYAVHNFAMFKYLTHGFPAAMEAYEKYIAQYEAKHYQTRSHEWLLSAQLELVERHSACSVLPASPKERRRMVRRATEKFPQNPLFLRIFVECQTKSIVSQQLRRHFQSVIQRQRETFNSPSSVEWLFALLIEFTRAEMEYTASHGRMSGEIAYNLYRRWSPVAEHRLRVVLAQSIETARTEGSILLWQLYLRFELLTGNVEASKRIFYRGLHKCPWNKSFYLDGVQVLRPYLSSQELASLLALAVEKDIYLRNEIAF